MKSPLVNIDFTVMAKALSKHVREKAAHSNSTIIFLKNNVIVEENPKNNRQDIFKPSLSKGK